MATIPPAATVCRTLADVAERPSAGTPLHRIVCDPAREAAPLLTSDLPVEMLSRRRASREMEAKLHEYFEAGVRLVWCVDPRAQTVFSVYQSPERANVLTGADTLAGGDVLPGLEIDLKALFTPPKAPARKGEED